MGTVLSKPSRPATQEANFTYPRLKNVKNDFRLVKIEERKKGKLLTCQMEVFNIDRLPTYAALSFFWKDGYDEPSQKKKLFPITINGKRHGVNANLHSVLQGLRDTRPGIWWWINELCVDPAAPQEMQLSEQQKVLVK